MALPWLEVIYMIVSKQVFSGGIKITMISLDRVEYQRCGQVFPTHMPLWKWEAL